MPLEINCRLGGCETWSMIKASMDIDLMFEILDISLGIPLDEKKLASKSHSPHSCCISINFRPIEIVFIDKIQLNLKNIQKSDAIEIMLIKSPGDNLTGKEIIGWAVAKIELKALEHNKCLANLKNILDGLLNNIIICLKQIE